MKMTTMNYKYAEEEDDNDVITWLDVWDPYCLS